MFKRPTLMICCLVLFCLGVVTGCKPAVEQPSSPAEQAPASTTIPVDEAPPSTTTPADAS